MLFLLVWAVWLNCSFHRNVTQWLEADVTGEMSLACFLPQRLRFLSEVWTKIELLYFICKIYNMGVLILKWNVNTKFKSNKNATYRDFMEKFIHFIYFYIFFSPYSGECCWYWHIFETMGKVEVNIKHLNSKDVVLTVLQMYYLDTMSQPNVIWNRENKHKGYDSKSKTSKKVLLVTLHM